jgi:hypothetical protein
MQIPVWIEKVAGNGFLAKSFGLSAQAPTREEALSKLKGMMDALPESAGETVWIDLDRSDPFYLELLQQQIEVLQQEVAALRRSQEKPWLKVKGVCKDDPLFDEWQEAIAEYRREVDEDPNAR